MAEPKLPVPLASVKIRAGVKTNRVGKVVRAKPTKVAMPARTPTSPKPRPEPKRYRADRSLDGRGVKVVAMSWPPRELAELDRVADRAQMNRSHFIRQAVKHFIAKVESTDYGALEDQLIADVVDDLEAVLATYRARRKARRV